MKVLVVEDDFTSRVILQETLKKFGPVHVAVNGEEAVEAVKKSIDDKEPYNLICLDINMPKMNGHEALVKIRALEDEKKLDEKKRSKIIMTTASKDKKNIMTAFNEQCDGYVVKPVDAEKLFKQINSLDIEE